MNVVEALLTRSSVREYKDKKIPDEILRQILDCGNNAPISGQVHFTVISSKVILDEMDKLAKKAIQKSDNDFLKKKIAVSGYRLDYNAPHVILVSSTERTYKEANGACAVANMCNAAVGDGFGCCFLAGIMFAFKERPDLKEDLGIPKEFLPQFAMCLGYSSAQNVAKKKRYENYRFI